MFKEHVTFPRMCGKSVWLLPLDHHIIERASFDWLSFQRGLPSLKNLSLFLTTRTCEICDEFVPLSRFFPEGRGRLPISQYQKYHNTLSLPLQNFVQALFPGSLRNMISPKRKLLKKIKTMLLQNFGVQAKNIMIFL